MDLEGMTKDELIAHIKQMNEYMDNVVVFWGDKRELLVTFQEVARNENHEYTTEEAANASTIVETDGAFEEFVKLTRDSFDRGGISYVLSEKISALMAEVASRHRDG